MSKIGIFFGPLKGAVNRVADKIKADLGDEAVKWGREGRLRVSDMFNFETTQKHVEGIYMDLENRPEGG